MKQKVFDYIEELERKAKESEKYFKLWHEEKIKNNKVLFILEHMEDDRIGYEVCIDILKGVDKE